MRSALLFYRNGGFELWDWQFLRNPDRLTRPCTGCRLETSSRLSPSVVAAVEVTEKWRTEAMLEWVEKQTIVINRIDGLVGAVSAADTSALVAAEPDVEMAEI